MDALISIIKYLTSVYFGGFVVKLCIQSFKEARYFGFGLYLFNAIAVATALVIHVIFH